MKIEELSKKIDKYHEENRDTEWMNLGLMAGGFGLAATSLATADPKWSTIVIAAIFGIIGLVSYCWGLRRKRKRQEK